MSQDLSIASLLIRHFPSCRSSAESAASEAERVARKLLRLRLNSLSTVDRYITKVQADRGSEVLNARVEVGMVHNCFHENAFSIVSGELHWTRHDDETAKVPCSARQTFKAHELT